MIGNLYKLDIHSDSDTALVPKTAELWHLRLAHTQPSTIGEMAKSKAVHGFEIGSSNKSGKTYSSWVLGKARRTSIPKQSQSRSTQLLQLVNSDVNGPLEVPSMAGSRYFAAFVDDFSRWTSIFTIKKKLDSFSCLKIFRAQAEKHTGTKLKSLNVLKRTTKSSEELKILRIDNVGEYLSNEFKSCLPKHGIQHQLTVAYTPQQNGVAERMNRTLMDCVRSMLRTSSLDKKFWAEALATAVYIRNRVVSRSLPYNITPHHRWIGEAPNICVRLQMLIRYAKI